MSPFFLVSSLVVDIMALIAWVMWLRRMDRFAANKRPVAWLPVFLLGGMASAFLSLIVYDFNPFWFLSQDSFVEELSFMTFYVGVSEELAKFLVFLALSFFLKNVREPLDGALHGATVGLGFALVENFVYGVDYGPVIALIRSVACVSSHMAYAAISGAVWGITIYWREIRKDLMWPGLLVVGIAAASILHGLGNALTRFSLTIPLSFDALVAYWLYRLLRDSSSLSPYYSYGRARRAEALQAIGRGLALDPGNWILRHREGLYLASGGDWAKASVSFKGAAKAGARGVYARAFRAAADAMVGGAQAQKEAASCFKVLSPGNQARFLKTIRSMLSTADAGKIESIVCQPGRDDKAGTGRGKTERDTAGTHRGRELRRERKTRAAIRAIESQISRLGM